MINGGLRTCHHSSFIRNVALHFIINLPFYKWIVNNVIAIFCKYKQKIDNFFIISS